MATVKKAPTRRVEGGATECIYNRGEGEILEQFTCRRKVVKMVSLRAVSYHAVLNHSLLTLFLPRDSNGYVSVVILSFGDTTSLDHASDHSKAKLSNRYILYIFGQKFPYTRR